MRAAIALSMAVALLGAATVFSWIELEARQDRVAAFNPKVALRTSTPKDSPLPASTGFVTPAMSGGVPKAPVTPVTAGSSRTVELNLDKTDDLETWYPDLGRSLGISEAEAQQFLQLLARQRTSTSQAIRSAVAGGQSPREVEQLMRRKVVADEAEQAAALGGRYPLWIEEQDKGSAQIQAKRMVQLASAGIVLDAQERSRLEGEMSAAIAEVSREFRNRPSGTAANRAGIHPSMYPEQRLEVNRRVVDIAKKVLSGDKLEQFRLALSQEVETLRVMEARRD